MAYLDELANIDAQVTAALVGSDCSQVLAMAYVPIQSWGDLYDESLALTKGTLFPDLDKPFTGRKQVRRG